MKLKLMTFMSFIFIVFIVVFVLFFFNNRYQIELFENGFVKTYYANTYKTLETSTDSMAASLGALVKGMDEADQIKVIKRAINDYRFGPNKDGYYFVAKGTILLVHPEKKLVGTDVGNIQDPNGTYLFQKLDEAALKGGGIVSYMWPKPGHDGVSKPTPKNSYATLIPNTNGMYISTGVYTDDLKSSTDALTAPIKSKMLYSFWTNLIITFIILLVCSLIAGLIFYKYIVGSITYIKDSLTNFFTSLSKNEITNMKLLDKKLKDEFKTMANVINSNITNIQLSLSKDSEAVSEALNVAKTIEEGNLSVRILKLPSNPQLIELRD
ncbi:cache domain-containing protein, partial [Helicobacter sp. 13S00401-1]|uniref:cache domain-containing protein n=1 Tax=Helicobacter sp. 13S00401-1 TaxID=1905758 RepID=UPI0015521791